MENSAFCTEINFKLYTAHHRLPLAGGINKSHLQVGFIALSGLTELCSSHFCSLCFHKPRPHVEMLECWNDLNSSYLCPCLYYSNSILHWQSSFTAMFGSKLCTLFIYYLFILLLVFLSLTSTSFLWTFLARRLFHSRGIMSVIDKTSKDICIPAVCLCACTCVSVCPRRRPAWCC